MPIKLERDNSPIEIKKDQNDNRGFRIGDMRIAFSDQSNEVRIARYINDPKETIDTFQPRVIPEPSQPPIIINKRGKRYEIIETIQILPNQEPITRKIIYTKDNKNFTTNITFYNQ